MLDFSFDPPGAGWTSVGNAMLVLISGVALVSFLDFIIFSVPTSRKKLAQCCTRDSDKKYTLKLRRAFHALFHSLHLLILFVTLWVSISKVMSEDAASKVFGGLAVGMGFAMQGMLKSVVCYFRLLLGGEILEECELTVQVDGMKITGKVEDISIFHVGMRTDDGMIYVSNSKLMEAIFTVRDKRSSNGAVHKIVFRHRLVR